VSAVLLSQARYLLTAGYGVTVVARSGGSEQALVHEGAAFVELRGDGLSARLTHWAAICREHRIDVVVDHQVLYTKQWPEFALVARAEGAVTI
ncbi:hypothetical protein, partial [Enterococcus faecium]|uniref:hypothetical protein n=1 Tax=Enterococcus faecium TaxID=1352 RepID=UPI0034E9640A